MSDAESESPTWRDLRKAERRNFFYGVALGFFGGAVGALVAMGAAP